MVRKFKFMKLKREVIHIGIATYFSDLPKVSVCLGADYWTF